MCATRGEIDINYAIIEQLLSSRPCVFVCIDEKTLFFALRKHLRQKFLQLDQPADFGPLWGQLYASSSITKTPMLYTLISIGIVLIIVSIAGFFLIFSKGSCETPPLNTTGG